MIRKATNSDICGIAEIYQGIFEKEKSGVSTTGWIEGVYPTRQTAVEDYQMAKELGGLALRMDTNEKNLPTRRMYRRLGFQEVGIVPCNFNGIEGGNLVCLERAVE